MATGAADFGTETADITTIEVCRFGGRQVVSQQDYRFGQFGQRPTSHRAEVLKQLLFDIDNIVGSLGQQRIVKSPQVRRIAMQHLADGISGRLFALADASLQFGVQTRIVQHLQLSGEDVAG